MPNTGALFVAVPASDDPINALSEEDQAHVTLTWFGEAKNLPVELELELLETLDQVAASVGPFTASIVGTATIGPDKAGVLLIESAELVAVREQMLTNPAVRQAQELAERQFPWWIPHLTVAYGKPLPDDYPESVQIDRLGFWSAGTKAYSALEASDEDSVTAGLCVPPIWDVDDLPLGIRVASGNPAVRWYVARRARALGQIEQIPSHWSMA